MQSCVGEQSHGGTPGQGAGSSPMAGAHVQHLFAQLKFKSLKLTMNAVLQRRFGSPFIFREEDPSRQVSLWPGRSHVDLVALEMLQHPALIPVGKPQCPAEGLEQPKPGTQLCRAWSKSVQLWPEPGSCDPGTTSFSRENLSQITGVWGGHPHQQLQHPPKAGGCSTSLLSCRVFPCPIPCPPGSRTQQQQHILMLFPCR